ncbi:hypothetical protein HK405_006228, partial [Cladochytrium tenue]
MAPRSRQHGNDENDDDDPIAGAAASSRLDEEPIASESRHAGQPAPATVHESERRVGAATAVVASSGTRAERASSRINAKGPSIAQVQLPRSGPASRGRPRAPVTGADAATRGHPESHAARAPPPAAVARSDSSAGPDEATAIAAAATAESSSSSSSSSATAAAAAAAAAEATSVSERLERGRRSYHRLRQRRGAELEQLREEHESLARDVGELQRKLAAAGSDRQGWLAAEVVYLK